MEDLRKSTDARKKEVKNFNTLAIIMGFFRYIKSKWKAILFWVTFILIINIIFNPKNTALFISNWYDNFIGTLIEGNNDNTNSTTK